MKQKHKLREEVFRPEYIPETIVDREKQRKQIEESVESGLDTYIEGETGTGKTLVLKKLEEELDQKVVYLNAIKTPTLHQGALQILRAVGNPLQVFATGTPTGEVIQNLEEERQEETLVILDEPEKLKDKDFLKYLLDSQKIQLIMASNSSSFPSKWSSEIQSRVESCQHIRFPQYSKEELLEIAWNRAEESRKPDRFDEEAQELVKQCGDARTAISIVQKSLKDMDISRPSSTKPETDLNEDQEILLEIVREHEDGINPSALYEKYGERVEKPKVKRTLRKYLKELDRQELIDSEGQGRWRKYKPCGE